MYPKHQTSENKYRINSNANKSLFKLIICFILLFSAIQFCYAAIGYKKFLKGLIVGALLSKGKAEDQHHYFYPVYDSMPYL